MAFLVILWSTTLLYVYASYDARFFPKLPAGAGWAFPFLALLYLLGILMLAGPTLLLSLSIRSAPQSIAVKSLATLVGVLAVAASLSSLDYRGPDRGLGLFLYMVASWAIGAVTLIGVAIVKRVAAQRDHQDG